MEFFQKNNLISKISYQFPENSFNSFYKPLIDDNL
jgi:hypothetical protein